MFNKIYKIGYYTFLSAIGVIALLVVFSAFPIQGNFQIKVVQSGSMEPAIHVGSIVIIKPANTYAVGDVITFDGNFRDDRGNKVPITHRIVEIKGEGSALQYLMKGDANEDVDDKAIAHKSVIGKVLVSVPYLGYAINAAKEPYGFLAIILIPAFIIIWDEGLKIYRALGEMKKKKPGKEPTLEKINGTT